MAAKLLFLLNLIPPQFYELLKKRHFMEHLIWKWTFTFLRTFQNEEGRACLIQFSIYNDFLVSSTSNTVFFSKTWSALK